MVRENFEKNQCDEEKNRRLVEQVYGKKQEHNRALPNYKTSERGQEKLPKTGGGTEKRRRRIGMMEKPSHEEKKQKPEKGCRGEHAQTDREFRLREKLKKESRDDKEDERFVRRCPVDEDEIFDSQYKVEDARDENRPPRRRVEEREKPKKEGERESEFSDLESRYEIETEGGANRYPNGEGKPDNPDCARFKD